MARTSNVMTGLMPGLALGGALWAATGAVAQTTSLTEAEVVRHLSARTFQMRRGPATFARNGDYTFNISGGQTIKSRWQACGSAVCLDSGWRGALEVAGGEVILIDPQGNRISLGRKK